jgi:hypothetical protein
MDPVAAPEPCDPVIEAYKTGVDQTLFDQTLALSPEERIRQLQAFVRFQQDLRTAGERALKTEHDAAH